MERSETNPNNSKTRGSYPRKSRPVDLQSVIHKAIDDASKRQSAKLKEQKNNQKKSKQSKQSKPITKSTQGKRNKEANPNKLDSTASTQIRFRKQKAPGTVKKKRITKLKKGILKSRKLIWYLKSPEISPIPLIVHPALVNYYIPTTSSEAIEDSKDVISSIQLPSTKEHSSHVHPVFFGHSYRAVDTDTTSPFTLTEEHLLNTRISDFIFQFKQKIERNSKQMEESSKIIKSKLLEFYGDILGFDLQLLSSCVYDINLNLPELDFRWNPRLNSTLSESQMFELLWQGLRSNENFIINKDALEEEDSFPNCVSVYHRATGTIVNIYYGVPIQKWDELWERIARERPLVIKLFHIVKAWSQANSFTRISSYLWMNLILIYLLQDKLTEEIALNDIVDLLPQMDAFRGIWFVEFCHLFATSSKLVFSVIHPARECEDTENEEHRLRVLDPFSEEDLFEDFTTEEVDEIVTAMQSTCTKLVASRGKIDSLLASDTKNGNGKSLALDASVKLTHAAGNAVPIREYVQQALSSTLDDLVKTFLSKLFGFQERQRLQDPVKGAMRRRLVMGVREVIRGIKTGRCKCVIIAPNIEQVATSIDGNMDDKIKMMITLCEQEDLMRGKQKTPVVFALSKKHLGNALGKSHTKISAIGIYSTDGAHEEYKEILKQATQLRFLWSQVVESERRRGDTTLCVQCGKPLSFVRCDCRTCGVSRCVSCVDSIIAKKTPCIKALNSLDTCDIVRIARILPLSEVVSTSAPPPDVPKQFTLNPSASLYIPKFNKP